MTTGTLTHMRGIDGELSTNKTVGCVCRETEPAEEQIRKELLEVEYGPEVFYEEEYAYFANPIHFQYMAGGMAGHTSRADWKRASAWAQELALNVWDTPRLKRLLDAPLGAPISLTMEEADEIVRLAAGRRPDLPAGEKFTRDVRELLGHSLMGRLKKAR